MEIKRKFLISFIVPASAVATAIGLPFAGAYYINNFTNQKVDNSKFEKYADDFMKSDNGDILRLPIDKNQIPVILRDMDEQTKTYVVDGINALDNISENINYTIYDASKFDTKSNVEYISIEMVDGLTDYGKSSDAAGCTFFSYDKHSAEILYPIDIKIENYYADGFWDSEYTQSVLTTIVKHELMHTLGFKDLYEEEDRNRSIMYYALGVGTPQTFTQEDIEKIQYCYDGKEVATVTRPNQLLIANYSSYLDSKKDHKNKDDGLSL